MKDSGAPLGAHVEFDKVDLAAKSDDGTPVIPVDAHIRLAAPSENDGIRILRRGYSFTDGMDERLGQLDAGLFFIGYMSDPDAFITLQHRLGRIDALNEYITHNGSALFAVPPGVQPGGYRGPEPVRLSRILSRSGTHLSTSSSSRATTCSALALSDADVLAAVEAAVRAQGEGAVTLDPRVHHVPDPSFPGHFNLLRATVWPLGVTGVKVVGDYVENHTKRPSVGAWRSSRSTTRARASRSRSSTGLRSRSGARAR